MMALLDVAGVTKRFGGVVAVSKVDLTVEAGSIAAVIGPNGAGKTSLFNVVSGFEKPDDGAVTFDGTRVERMTPWQIAGQGLVRSFQTPVGFPELSVWENLMVAGSDRTVERVLSAFSGRWKKLESETNDRARRLLSQLELDDARDTRLADLTPGDVKLVDFARQLMVRPTMMLLDEPASGVDPASIGRLSNLIQGVRDEGITVLVIDHNIGFVLGIADVVHVMALGEVIARGTPDEIVKNPSVVEIYLGKRT
jgi:ABC-type branched-subunit amino acid transport system ATPase component